MSIEQTLLAYARPPALAQKARAMVRAEAGKGCRPEIAPEPVALEPPYQPLLTAGDHAPTAPEPLWVPQPPAAEDDLLRFQVWISPRQTCDWKRAERFLKELASASHRLGLEIIGNRQNITIRLLCHRQDAALVENAFRAEFEECELSQAPSTLEIDGWQADQVAFDDYYPAPPYSHLLTRPDELHCTLYKPIIQALAGLPEPGLGLYQVLFEPVSADHDWHRNVEALLDLEFSVRLLSGLAVPQRYLQQAPSGDLRQMAADVETKAHADKPFFAAAVRAAVTGVDDPRRLLGPLATVRNLIQHGGRPLNRLTEQDYAHTLGPRQLLEMFGRGLAYRCGFLVNSWELTSLVHLPPVQITEPRRLPVPVLETLPSTPSLSAGTPIGRSFYAGRWQPVCIPPELRTSHVHLIGRSRMGKSTVMEHMILDDIQNGHGVAVLDPHGRLVERLLDLIPEQHADRVIYADPGDPDHVLLWNPLRQPPGRRVDRGRVADDIVTAYKSFMSGWGDRLEHLLRHAIEGAMHLPEGSLFDVSNLLRKNSPESKALRRRILEATDNQAARLFWQEDFERYTNADLSPPQHKLSKLLGSGLVSLMLSQPHSAFELRDIMDRGQILLLNLSTVGTETREILGCFMLSLLHLTALGRSDVAETNRRPFHIHCDEAHRFLTDALEDLIAETRKFGVSLALAHQYMSQFGTRKTDALSSVESTIIFNLDTRDAGYLRKDLRGKVKVDDLTSLNCGEAIARIGTEVVRLQTHPPLEIPAGSCRDRILAESRRRYYRPAHEVRQMLLHPQGWWIDPPPAFRGEAKEFAYDKF